MGQLCLSVCLLQECCTSSSEWQRWGKALCWQANLRQGKAAQENLELVVPGLGIEAMDMVKGRRKHGICWGLRRTSASHPAHPAAQSKSPATLLVQWSRLKPSYEFHFEGRSNFSPSVERLVRIQDINPRI